MELERVEELDEVLYNISLDCLEMSLQPTWRTTVLMSGWSACMLGFFSIMSVTLAPGKQKVSADGFLIFLTIESPMMSSDVGGVAGGVDLTLSEVDLSGRAERWTGCRRGAGVKSGVERQAQREERSDWMVEGTGATVSS